MPRTRNKTANSEPAPRGRPSKRLRQSNQRADQSSGLISGQNSGQNSDQISPNRDIIVENDNHMHNNEHFSAEQLQSIKGIIQDTMAVSCRDIATQAATAAVNALRDNNTNLTTPINVPAADSTLPVIEVSPTISTENSATLPQLPPSSVANQDIPAPYVREINTGEFFDLSKLLPKNLSLYDEDDNLTLTLENSTVKVTKKKKSGQSQITDIEQWTTVFTTYMSVFTYKYPLRAQELLQYLSLIRYAARVHKGLGWAIYDHKFRQKAGLAKSLVWSQIDQHLWLTIFTVSASSLKEEYPLFNNGPHNVASKGDVRGLCHEYNRVGVCNRDPCEYQHICNRCRGQHPGRDCYRSSWGKPAYTRDEHKGGHTRDDKGDHSHSKTTSSSSRHK